MGCLDVSAFDAYFISAEQVDYFYQLGMELSYQRQFSAVDFNAS